MPDSEKIAVGDIVNVWSPLDHNGEGWNHATVLHCAQDVGDCWHFRLANGQLLYLQQFAGMLLVEKGSASDA